MAEERLHGIGNPWRRAGSQPCSAAATGLRGPLLACACILALLPISAARAATSPNDRWEALRAPGVTVVYRPGQHDAARRAVSAALQASARIGAELGSPPQHPFTLVLHPSHRDFARAIGIPRRQLVVGIAAAGDLAHIDASDTVADIPTVVAHEVAHLLLEQATGGSALPSWFDEGYAEHAAGSLEWDSRERLAEAAVSGGLFSLEQLSGAFPREGDAAAIAYAQSHASVTHILKHAPPNALIDLARRLRSGEPFDNALMAATGRTSSAWEVHWRRDFHRRFRWYPWLAFGAGASGLLMAILCLLAFRSIVRHKRRLPDDAP